MTIETIIATAIAIAATITTVAAWYKGGKHKQQLHDAQATIDATKEEQQRTRQELAQQRQSYLQAREENATLKAEKHAAEQNLQQRESKLQQDMQHMKNEFKNISQEIFSKNTDQSSKNIKDLIDPLKEKISDFQKNLAQSFNNQTQQQTALKTQIEHIVNTSKTLKDQTDNLVNALKADVRVQGRWGEVMLERIVQAAGLREGEEYTTQGRGMNIKYDQGTTMKPDLIVHLPDNRNIVIDAKVSLKSYEQYANASTEEERQQHLKDFTTSMQSHIQSLADRSYHSKEELNSPDFTLLFTPVEGAFTLLMQQQQNLQEQAWKNHIAIVSPTTLWPILITVQSLWRIERQNRNAQQIAEEGGKLYDKIAGFAEDMDKLGKQIKTVNKTYNEATTKLTTGTGNILRRADNLKQLGAKTSKPLPQEIDNILED